METLTIENTVKLINEAINKATVKGGFNVDEVYSVKIFMNHILTCTNNCEYDKKIIVGSDSIDYEKSLMGILLFLNQAVLRGAFNLEEAFSIKLSHSFLENKPILQKK